MSDQEFEDWLNTADLTTDLTTHTIDQAMRDAGLDPTDWVATKARFDSQTGKATLHAERIRIHPARTTGPRWKPRPDRGNDQLGGGSTGTRPVLAVVLSDPQFPYHDTGLHQAICEFLRRTRPRIIVCAGDGPDFPTLSTYDPRPEMDAHANACIQATYEGLRDWRIAAGRGCKAYYIPGNHDQRLQKYLLRNAPGLHGLRRARMATGAEYMSESEWGVLTLPFLLRLDELGYKWVGGGPGEWQDWPNSTLWLTPHLAVKHGWLARKWSGRTAQASLENFGHSLIVGHSHRQALVFHTRAAGDSIDVLAGAETGTLARVVGGLGYAVNPDWQQGFVTARLFDDGTFHIELAQYVKGMLLWGNMKIQGGGEG